MESKFHNPEYRFGAGVYEAAGMNGSDHGGWGYWSNRPTALWLIGQLIDGQRLAPTVFWRVGAKSTF